LTGLNENAAAGCGFHARDEIGFIYYDESRRFGEVPPSPSSCCLLLLVAVVELKN
jgi:hypothetical protein